ncbi:UvrD-helicase domain-containing protein [Rhodoferax sp.]|uniref:UvrD-helicase domain-containing protein n=1 Tax=Rhodoferax sp. TaxID=50421 RepID=UPI002772FA1E|nr:UvrD-helicase domain-containing protein [Rhodoferax sp.]
MTAVRLVRTDLALLKRLTPDLNFDDAERQEALLENGPRDFNAVPGSGKTSLLAAKLLLLAKKWPHAKKGVCILSHTNVAREEIARRLAQTEEGSRLLIYPHFLGTIHSFANQFLAMPALRSLGLQVDVIDDNVFAKRAMAKLNSNRFFTLRGWLRRQPNGDALVSKLFFKGPDLGVVSEGGDLPSDKCDSGKQLATIKRELAEVGVFRHRDMFAFADIALGCCPNLLDVVHRRFPMVFVDEMQDTSWEQEDILNRLFDGKSVVQRFGDVDQKIIMNDDEGDKATFPRAGHGTVSTSKRFGSRIADAVASVRLSKLPVKGDAADDISPVLLLYKTADVGKVIRRFGQLVVDRFDSDALRAQTVRAMCTRKLVDGTVDPGRHLGDYWPAFAQALRAGETGGSDGFWRLLDPQATGRPQATLAERVGDVRRAVLQVLRAAKAPVTTGLRDGRALIRAVAEQAGNALEVQRLVLELVLKSDLFDTPQAREAIPELLHGRLCYLLPPGMNLATFKALDVFAQPVVAAAVDASPTACVVVHAGHELRFTLGTVAGMKGETHLASLVLESYGGRSRKFDLEVALPCIAGLGKDIAKLSALQKVQMRNVYVAMSRPTRFLCLAANESRVALDIRQALEAKGWQIEQVA